MKRMLLIAFLLNFFILSAFSQDGDYSLKRVEQNILGLVRIMQEEGVLPKRFEHNIIHGMFAHYNLNSKRDMEKFLLGDFNAPVEFFFLPSFQSPSSLRIVKDSLNSWNLEVKYISNFKEVDREVYQMYPTISMGGFGTSSINITDEERKRISEHNAAVQAKKNEERFNLYKVDTLSLPISNQFAEQLYEKMVSFIVNFKVKGFLNRILIDGYSVSFRTVIDDEVWSLWIHDPYKTNVRKMADLCREIISDARANQLDESKYITILETFEK